MAAIVTEAELSGKVRITVQELLYVVGERKRKDVEFSEVAESEGRAMMRAFRAKRPKRRPRKKPGWMRFKVQYHTR